MRIRPLALALALTGVSASVLPAQTTAGRAADSAGVRQAVLDYVEGLYLADTARIVRGVSPDLVKYGYWREGAGAEYEGSSMSFAQLVALAKRWNANRRKDPAKMPKEVRVLDVLDKTAPARLTADWGVDYFHLAKLGGRWQIVQVLWQSPPPKTTAAR
jgi:hypothetical protein